MAWLKGTEWRWNNDGHWSMKLERSGDIDAPIQQCQMGCKWTATNGKVYLSLGDAGIFQLDTQEEKPANMKGHRMRGRSLQDGQRLTLTFIKVFDHEAANLEKDLYWILGVPDDADERDIKKVYKKLSIKYHPDKNPDEASREMFNEIRDAYEILNDPDKKILYDTGGMEAVKKGEKGEVQKTDDVNSEIDVSLKDLYTSNSDMKAHLSRRVVCRGCRMKPGAQQCLGCGRCPNEVKVVNVQMGPFMTQQQQEVPSKEKCKTADVTIDVNIEKGMRDGESLTYPRMAEERPGMLPGSVILKLKTKKHPLFTRRSDDLHMDMKISLRESLLGWSQTIRHLDGHTLELSTKAVTSHLQVVKAKGEGMPLRDDPASFGNLHVKVAIDFPSQISEKQKEEIAKIFPPSPSRPIL
jgi:DnaJ-class molecular chaperone